ncbi:MAG: SulP family inorganic anion transporter, partial [Anaerolineae bacterium]
VGFAAGAGLLIVIKQIGPLIGVHLNTANPFAMIQDLIGSWSLIHWPTFLLGSSGILFLILLRRVRPQAPAPLILIALTTGLSIFLQLNEQGVAMIGEIPRSLPPLTAVSLWDLQLIARLSTGALAVGAIGLVQTSAIVRSIASQTGQRVDNNQEFVAQGMANLAAGFFSGYPCAASFSRTAVNYRSGAKSPVAAIFSGLFVLFAMLVLAPLAVFLPVPVLAGLLIITAYGMIDKAEIKRIWQGARGDALIMIVTLLGTLFLDIEFAVLVGIMISFGRYIFRTSLPRVHTVVPDASYSHFEYAPERSRCPQLGIVDIEGDLYFGAVNHVEEAILNIVESNQEQRFLLIRMTHVNHCDFSGIHMLESVVKACRDRGGDIFFVRVNIRVRKVMQTTHFDESLGIDHFLSEDEAIAYIFHRILDPAVCIYECPYKVFKECQNLPKRIDLAGIPLAEEVPDTSIFHVAALELWDRLHDSENGERPYVVDVREPREFRRGHIPEANLAPLPLILTNEYRFPRDRQIVLVCRTGRRSRRAAYALQKIGIVNVFTLAGGMQAWESKGLLTAIDQFL